MYKYIESPDFEILLMAYAFGEDQPKLIDFHAGDEMPQEVTDALADPDVRLIAHNAAFERLCLRRHGIATFINRWECTALVARYRGYPGSLEGVAKALGIEGAQKDANGKKLIQLFCVPRRDGSFADPDMYPEEWEAFGKYCIQDVCAEQCVYEELGGFGLLPPDTVGMYRVDQKMNDTGLPLDARIPQKALAVRELHKKQIRDEIIDLIGLVNPNSPKKFKEWLSERVGFEVKTVRKETIPDLLSRTDDPLVHKVLKLRAASAKSSLAKYVAMQTCVCSDGRMRGQLMFYGANRTGRWAGRLVQPQNLPKNNIHGLDDLRQMLLELPPEQFIEWTHKPADELAQLLRTAIVASPGRSLLMIDASAIEARVLAWLSGEEWRLEEFRGRGRIYEASASQMFGVPIDSITKDSPLRAKGKVSELALGYGGANGALINMGALRMGIEESELAGLVKEWRKANPAITAFWSALEKAAMRAVMNPGSIVQLKRYRGITFHRSKKADKTMTIELPSGRMLHYVNARIGRSKFGGSAVTYYDSDHFGFRQTDTYGGKLTENVTQAVAADLMKHAMLEMSRKSAYDMILTVHDEMVLDVHDEHIDSARKLAEQIMGAPPEWCKDLPLRGDSVVSPYYLKD